MSHRHGGDRAPTARELSEHGTSTPAEQKKRLADLRAQLGEAEAWLKKIRAALRVESNAHALARAKGLAKEGAR